jgi:hypothetical protein
MTWCLWRKAALCGAWLASKEVPPISCLTYTSRGVELEATNSAFGLHS